MSKNRINVCIGSAVAFYLAGVFAFASFDISLWPTAARFSTAVMWLIVVAIW